MSTHAQNIILQLKSLEDPIKARWLENYVKHDVKSFGVGIPEIRTIIQNFEKSTDLHSQSFIEQADLLNDLMKDEHTEPKLAAILYIQLYWKTEKVNETLDLISKWFDNGWISDWNVCDWLCVRLLTPILDHDPKVAIKVLSEWNKSQYLWKARASLVPFAQSKKIDQHIDAITIFSENLIRRDERFCKTAVGWVLREYSKKDRGLVMNFLKKHKQWTTKEVIKNAIKYVKD